MPSSLVTRREVLALIGALANVATARAGTNPVAGVFPQTSREAARRVVPTDVSYPPGNPRRYGAVGTGWKNDDTAAVQACIDCNNSVTFHQGDVYGVTSVAFPAGGPDFVDFNGAFIVGIARQPTPCIVAIKCSHTVFYGYQVFGLGNGSTVPNPNPNYACATWWYNPAGGSQYNAIFGMIHSTCARAVVYGALPGSKPAGGLQSENSIYGFRTVGCANPFYSNAQAGFVHFSEPIFYTGFESWTAPHPSTARALENYSGSIFAQGGEMQYASTAAGFAADLQGCILQGMNFETAPPIQIVGDGVQIAGGVLYNTSSTTPEFKVAPGVTGTMTITGASMGRGAGAGAFSRQPMIDATAAPGFVTVLQETTSSEWGWLLVGADCRLVKGGAVAYRNHRMRITAADPNTYVIDTDPRQSLTSPAAADGLGYTTAGWSISDPSGRSTLLTSTEEGPPGYLPSQLDLTAVGTVRATMGTTTSAAEIRTSLFRVRPGELYWPSCWLKNTSATAVKLVAEFRAVDGSPLTSTVIADGSAIGVRTWSLVEGPLSVPPRAAYMAIGIEATTGSVLFTDVRVQRAS